MKKIRVALIGCGGYQNTHAVRIKENPDAQIVALCDVDEKKAKGLVEKSLADQHPPPPFYDDVTKMYASIDLDAVFIATPHTTHFDHCMAALEAGCHVYVEKPMVTSAGHAHMLADKVKQTGKVLVVGYNTPCSPEFSFLRARIREKTYGKLELVVGHLSQGWLGPTNGTWRQQPELSGGGQAYDSGAHLLNSLVWSVESNIDQVHAYIDNHGTAVDVNSSINIRFANGVLASIVISGNCPANGAHMAFIFDQGKIEVEAWTGAWIKVYDGGSPVKYPAINDKTQWPDDNFIDAIHGRAEPRTTPLDGIVQSELMDAIYESARTGQPARPKRR